MAIAKTDKQPANVGNHRGHDTLDIPETQWLSVTDLKVDFAYQHRPYANAIEDLRKGFRPDLCGFILVNVRENGDMYIIDGQTRKVVHEETGRAWILSEIKRGLTQQEEASAYLVKAVNKQRGPVDWYHAGVVAGDQVSVLIETILQSFEIVVVGFATERGGAMGKAVVSCVASMKRIIRLDPTGDLLRATLDLVIATWGYDKQALAGRFLETMAGLVKEYGEELERRSFIHRLGGPIGDLYEASRLLRQASTPRPSLKNAVKRKILELYNVGRKDKLA